LPGLFYRCVGPVVDFGYDITRPHTTLTRLFYTGYSERSPCGSHLPVTLIPVVTTHTFTLNAGLRFCGCTLHTLHIGLQTLTFAVYAYPPARLYLDGLGQVITAVYLWLWVTLPHTAYVVCWLRGPPRFTPYCLAVYYTFTHAVRVIYHARFTRFIWFPIPHLHTPATFTPHPDAHTVCHSGLLRLRHLTLRHIHTVCIYTFTRFFFPPPVPVATRLFPRPGYTRFTRTG